MKTYKILDLNKSMFDDITIEANSMIQALQFIGYTNISRDYTGKGNIIITHNKRTYVFFGDKK